MSKKVFVCPEEDALTLALCRVLSKLYGWDKTEAIEEASLVIVNHIIRDVAIQSEYLSFYSKNYGDITRKVLLFDVFGNGGEQQGIIFPWLYRVSSFQFDLSDFIRWLSPDAESIKLPTSLPVVNKTPQDCRNLIYQAMGGQPGADFFTEMIDRSTPSVDTKVKDFFSNNNSLPHFYYSLLCISGNFAAYEHDVMKKLSKILLNLDSMQEVMLKKTFTEACEGLKNYLNTLLPVAQGNKKILFIDDNHDEYEKLLVDIFRNREDITICFWNPSQKEIDHLKKYGALSKNTGMKISVQTKRTVGPSDDGVAPIELAKLITELRFIIVDQLFSTDNQPRFEGPEIIMALSRMGDDLVQKKQAVRMPGIIALSRSPSPDVIKKALKAGARAYALKSNLLSLPAVLAKTEKTSTPDAGSLVRNFRSLHDLPNEIIGLLKSTKTPQLIHESEREVFYGKPRVRMFSDLLRSIPKTDLHVHVGSCMQPEFLVSASLIGLVQQKDLHNTLRPTLTILNDCITPGAQSMDVQLIEMINSTINYWGGEGWISSLAKSTKDTIFYLLETLDKENYRKLRSVLHEQLKISDFLDLQTPATQENAFEKISDLKLALFALRNSTMLNDETIIRTYLLVLAAKKNTRENPEIIFNNKNILKWFDLSEQIDQVAWINLHKIFYGEDDNDVFSIKSFRQNGWRIPDEGALFKINLCAGSNFTFDESPIAWTLATGERSNNLKQYLEGCEFSGSEHMKHPFLLHLYAQHVMKKFIEDGLMYVELRGSPDGYTNSDAGFMFSDACQCFVEAFNYAQETTVKKYYDSNIGSLWLPEIMFEGDQWNLENLFNNNSNKFPCKVSFILVGKRHKSTSQMILETAASAIMHQSGISMSADIREEMDKCRVVGFDLAGSEADYPPGQFAEEFRRLGRLHIPMTVHAGENASSEFVEDAILELGARRLGHALSLADDKRLMERVREERICVELCPMSNHQTCHFTPEKKTGRTYPLKDYLHAGIPVCLNTDNPIISNTDILEQYYKAAYTMGKDGLSLWETIRIIKMGFRHAFLPLPVRRAMLEAADQMVFDFLSDSKTEIVLRELQELQETEL